MSKNSHWFFTKDQVLKHYGDDVHAEVMSRRTSCAFIQDLGIKLKLTPLCLHYVPEHISYASVYLATKFLNLPLTSEGKKHWWEIVDIKLDTLEEISNQILDLYDSSTADSINSNSNNDSTATTKDTSEDKQSSKPTLNVTEAPTNNDVSSATSTNKKIDQNIRHMVSAGLIALVFLELMDYHPTHLDQMKSLRHVHNRQINAEGQMIAEMMAAERETIESTVEMVVEMEGIEVETHTSDMSRSSITDDNLLDVFVGNEEIAGTVIEKFPDQPSDSSYSIYSGYRDDTSRPSVLFSFWKAKNFELLERITDRNYPMSLISGKTLIISWPNKNDSHRFLLKPRRCTPDSLGINSPF
eukprot:gene4339-5066_t